MNFIDLLINRGEIFKISDRIFFYDNVVNRIVNLLNDEELIIENPCRYLYDTNYIYLISNCQIIIYNSTFQIIKKIFDENITPEGSALLFFENNNYFLLNQTFDKMSRKLISQSKMYFEETVLEQEKFYGKILNKDYRLNFPEGSLSNPKTFRCSDLLDETTWWEYTCSDDMHATNLWIVRDDHLIFCENSNDSFIGKIVKVDLSTGQIKWYKELPNINLHYNESQGLLVSLWAGKEIGQHYQIIDIENETVEIGIPIEKFELHNVNTMGETQYLYEQKLFFTDYTDAFGEKLPVIKFGCFDLDTKKIDFLQDVPDAKGIGFLQVIYHDKKLYLRSYDNKLYIYE